MSSQFETTADAPFTTLSEAVLRKYPNPIFLETGTCEGGGIEVARRVGFERIISIEIDPEMHDRARERFRDEPRVELILGDSTEILRRVIRGIDQPITFWLDAHGKGWSARGSSSGKECPVVEELQIIAAHPIKHHSILIDDRRMFGPAGSSILDITGQSLDRAWDLTERDVLLALRDVNPDYLVSFEDGFEPMSGSSRKGDIIAARAAGGYFNEKFLRHLRKRRIRTIFECGSRLGADALALSSLFDARVFAFECNPGVRDRCAENLAGFDQIVLTRKAVWDSEGRIPFYPVSPSRSRFLPIWGREGNLGASSCFPVDAGADWFERYEQDRVEVESIRLDDFCRRHQVRRIDLLCLDLEGAELRALRGLGDMLSKVRFIITEVQKRPLYRGAPTYGELKAFLRDKRFSLVEESFGSDHLDEHGQPDAWIGDVMFARDLPVRFYEWRWNRRQRRRQEAMTDGVDELLTAGSEVPGREERAESGPAPEPTTGAPPGLALAREEDQVLYVPHLSLTEGELAVKFWKSYTIELFKRSVWPGSIVLDIGAHAGFFTLLAAKYAGSEGRVYSFEPDPATFEILRSNIEANGHANVETFEMAVADVSGTAELRRYGISEANSLCPESPLGLPARGTVTVATTRIDELFAGQRVNVVKVDAEGSEPAALRGMHAVLEANEDVVLFCDAAPGYETSAGEPESLVAMLIDFGFRPHLVDEVGQKVVPVEPGRYQEIRSELELPGQLYCIK